MLNDNDSNWAATRMVERLQECLENIEYQYTRPSVIYKPRIFQDGNKWCAILGECIVDGSLVGWGNSPNDAAVDFDKLWYKSEAKDV